MKQANTSQFKELTIKINKYSYRFSQWKVII